MSDGRIMLSPESMSVSASRIQDAADDDGLQDPSDIVTEFDRSTASSRSYTIDPDVCSGVYSIDYRLRQSNMSVLSRYKVCQHCQLLRVQTPLTDGSIRCGFVT